MGLMGGRYRLRGRYRLGGNFIGGVGGNMDLYFSRP